MTEDLNLQQQIDSLTARVTEQAVVIAKLEILIKHYEEQLLMARRHRFGSLSEKYPIGGEEYRQLGLFGEVSAEADKSIPECDYYQYKERHLVECFFNKLKQLGTRQ